MAEVATLPVEEEEPQHSHEFKAWMAAVRCGLNLNRCRGGYILADERNLLVAGDGNGSWNAEDVIAYCEHQIRQMGKQAPEFDEHYLEAKFEEWETEQAAA